MEKDRRSSQEVLRRKMLQDLTDAQRAAVNQLETFSWVLSFVRRPMFMDVIPVLEDLDSGRFALLEEDGTLNENHDLVIRP